MCRCWSKSRARACSKRSLKTSETRYVTRLKLRRVAAKELFDLPLRQEGADAPPAVADD
jgi:hypothetical protein